MKHEWKKQEKSLYLPSTQPELVTVPKQMFLMINGQGDPNRQDFAERVHVLYSLAYAIRMMPKQGYTPDGYFEYTVYPLEGVWDLTEEGRKSDILNKDELIYTLMIRQPDFVTREVVAQASEKTKKKKPHPLLDEVRFDTLEEGLCVQMLHIGSYDSESQSFEVMNKFTEDSNLQRISLLHREIYISDAQRVEASKLKTVLRFMVSQK